MVDGILGQGGVSGIFLGVWCGGVVDMYIERHLCLVVFVFYCFIGGGGRGGMMDMYIDWGGGGYYVRYIHIYIRVMYSYTHPHLDVLPVVVHQHGGRARDVGGGEAALQLLDGAGHVPLLALLVLLGV